jgi:hypothetical protein
VATDSPAMLCGLMSTVPQALRPTERAYKRDAYPKRAILPPYTRDALIRLPRWVGAGVVPEVRLGV